MLKTICLVDDDPSVRRALSRLLESGGVREDFAVRSIATQVGAAAFLLKPFEDAEFLEKVQYALNHRGGGGTKVRWWLQIQTTNLSRFA